MPRRTRTEPRRRSWPIVEGLRGRLALPDGLTQLAARVGHTALLTTGRGRHVAQDSATCYWPQSVDLDQAIRHTDPNGRANDLNARSGTLPSRQAGQAEDRWDIVLSRVRVVCGMVVLAVGIGLGAGGPSALRTAALALERAVPAAIIFGGIVLLFRVIAPQRAIGGPLLVVAIGMVALAIQIGILRTNMLIKALPAVLVAGGVLIGMSSQPPSEALPATVKRLWVLPGQRHIEIEGRSPAKFIIRCVLGSLVLDLAKADEQLYEDFTVDVTMIGGSVELVLPQGMVVRPGRLALAWRTKFFGTAAMDTDDEPFVTLNVQGILGRVTVRHESG